MTDRSELALQLTDAIVAAKAAAERAGDRAFRAYGLSHRAQAALVAVDLGGPDGARPKEKIGRAQSPCNLVCRLLLEKKKHESAQGAHTANWTTAAYEILLDVGCYLVSSMEYP